jgi:hypothetical protein
VEGSVQQSGRLPDYWLVAFEWDAGGMSELEPSDYRETLEALKHRVHDARFRLQRRANAELVALYWHIGDTILKKQDADG